MRLNSLKDLYVEELKDLYSAEKQQTRSLQKMAKEAESEELARAFETHLEETRGHIERLEMILRGLNASPGGHKCEAMAGLIKEAEEVLASDSDPEVLDAAMIAQAQRAEHYEIAGYGCARTYAKQLGREGDLTLLQESLDEEGRTDKMLTKLAERLINQKAMT